MTRTSILVLVLVAGCAREAARPAGPSIEGAVADAGATDSTKDVTAEVIVADANVGDDVVCRLLKGCDGGVDCPKSEACARCFADAKDDRARDACRDLFLRNGCLSRCVTNFKACELECRRVYRDPSAWPPATN